MWRKDLHLGRAKIFLGIIIKENMVMKLAKQTNNKQYRSCR